jgi:hypothetical protein
MTSQLNLRHDYTHETEDYKPTPYESFLWKIVNDETTPIDKQLRANLKAHLIDCGSPAAWEAVLKPYDEELNILDDETYKHGLQKLIVKILRETEQATFALTEEDYQEIAMFESEKLLEALRKGMLTVREIDRAILHFGASGYLKARPDVEQLLSSSHAGLRARALEVLILYWNLFSDYKERAFQFLADPDPGCRKQGLRCLNPEGEVFNDLPILQTYARTITNTAEFTSVRLCAYNELLIATGYHLDYDHWQEINEHLEGGGKLEQAPWIDWNLVRFFSGESDQFQTTLSFEIDEDLQPWVDQHGRAFYEIDELGKEIFLHAHPLAQLRFSDYQMTITFQPKKQKS